ncbi:disease resistance family protein / LRR family protein [Prunus dulcis]|uniref:Disease resistance family protein / LRR family protein n=1 Tax=Prunus dulcis TaxID=3755 RepID=A0A5H2XQT0_PRUDU|nr:disease resistance family protein / LRR family protein [Prunus dulcis]
MRNSFEFEATLGNPDPSCKTPKLCSPVGKEESNQHAMSKVERTGEGRSHPSSVKFVSLGSLLMAAGQSKTLLRFKKLNSNILTTKEEEANRDFQHL